MRQSPYLETAFLDGFSIIEPIFEEQHFFRTEIIGQITVDEGKIMTCDPFIEEEDTSLLVEFPIGTFPIQLSYSKSSDVHQKTDVHEEHIAFARIVFSKTEPVRWEMGLFDEDDMSDLGDDEYLGFFVESGAVAFLTPTLLELIKDKVSEQEDFLEHQFNILEKGTQKHQKIVLDYGVEFHLFQSGFGEGGYPCYIGYDADGAVCRLVIDFIVVG